MKTFVATICAIAMIFSLARSQSENGGYVLPDGVELIVGPIRSTFDCTNRIYGYYADIDNDCKLFHVCVPVVDDVGNLLDTNMYSFACGNQTVFDQQNLVCAYPEDATPCVQAQNLYDIVNSNFGVIPQK